MADNGAMFVGLEFFLLSDGKGFRIAPDYEIVDWDKLTDSLSRSPCKRGRHGGRAPEASYDP
jgi:hypothetical protein